ncbi:class I SAM-dependent methyltransferase [Marinitenerispora sediminis]|uniref:SAM-dependent methyltransferase n=1 Tax=Marinitenerispora sediminis TaxID=1931232 RepID=A0A368T8X2_9ACTN|nr:class I SAM-dependent methyltransferase [Marinitenerispora sediminis]RCV52072.1 SAM-dependent methyltransferase [Marinitenerispora sediminis]RCV58091.1 SAM-dependent methyltransferase [Marinitenerispora sediminis]RCV60847.1 SAM-dependent methyltransferase [Marinitenerispora sediminis]
MPTLPPPGPPPLGPQPHQHRRMAESFGEDAERYDRIRPRYPEALVLRIIAASPGPEVLDVGCGTGIAARQFRSAGCAVLGVEPDTRMAEVARRTGIEVEEATFEEWDPAGRSFDAVVAGQSWHWVDPAAGAVKAARVLRPGGRLAAFWHTSEPPSEVTEAFIAGYQRVVRNPVVDVQSATRRAPDGYQQLFTMAAGRIRKTGGFGEPEQWPFEWEQSYTRQEWLEQTSTSGVLTRLPPDKLAVVLESIGDAIDALGGSIVVRRGTVVVTAARTGA